MIYKNTWCLKMRRLVVIVTHKSTSTVEICMTEWERDPVHLSFLTHTPLIAQSILFILHTMIRYYICLLQYHRKERVGDFFIFGTAINHNKDLVHVKYTLCSVLRSSIYVHYFIICYVCSDISEMKWCILFRLGTEITHHRGFMHLKYAFSMCKS